jgi:hypothetical protein
MRAALQMPRDPAGDSVGAVGRVPRTGEDKPAAPVQVPFIRLMPRYRQYCAKNQKSWSLLQ